MNISFENIEEIIREKNTDYDNYKEKVYIQIIATPIDEMLVCADNNGICLLEFTERKILEKELISLSANHKAKLFFKSNTHIKNLQKQLQEYFSEKREKFEVPIVFEGTDFQKKVWTALLEIPYGKTRSYKQISIIIKSAGAVRAVANANGQNRIAILIPCHRVIGENGSMTGYSGKIWRKKFLLELENKTQKLF